MKKKKTSQKEPIVCRQIIHVGSYICFICNESRVLDCWIKDTSFFDGAAFDTVGIEDKEAIERLIIPSLEEYWSISKRAEYSWDEELERRCVTVFNPSWRKQIKKNVSS